MKITFNDDIKVAGIGLAPWTRLGPEQWLTNYKIISLYGVDAALEEHLPEIVSLSRQGAVPELAKLNTASLLASPEFRDLMDTELADYSFLPYKAVTIPPELANRQFLMVDPVFTQSFENKVVFRELFADQLDFPKFAVYDRAKLSGSLEAYERIADKRNAFVVQDEQLSGGKGTFIVRCYEDYKKALTSLDILSKSHRVVVSDIVEHPRERSIQACVTNAGIITGPLQRQIVHNPLLANMNVADGDKWCGAQIYEADQHTPTHHAAEAVVQTIGAELMAKGYRGIFGIDFLLDQQGELYIIEVNPRITGVTPLLAALYRGENGVPFYLLHILELGGFSYEITNHDAMFEGNGALLMLHSLENETMYIESMPPSGTYMVEDGALKQVSNNLQLSKLRDGEWILQEYLPPGMKVRPGGRIATILTKTPTIDTDSDILYNETVNAISAVREQIKMRNATI